MMKTIVNIKSVITLIVISVFLSSSCEEFELEPNFDSEVALEELKTEDDIVKVLAPIYRQFTEYVGPPHSYNIVGFGSDDITTWWAGNKAPLRVFDQFNYGAGENSDNSVVTNVWGKLWKIIYYSNTVIEGLKTSTAPEEVIKIADAEARFFRAIAYNYLVRSWGNVPIILDGYTPDGKEKRAASVLDNYQHIEEDLLIAKDNLPGPGEVSEPGRVSSAAAKTLLADFYLSWAGWPIKDVSKYELAAQYSREVIDLNYFELLPIHDLWLKENQNSKESVFSAQFSETEDLRHGGPSSNSFHEARGWSDMYPERQFFYDFPEGPRKEATFYTEIPQLRWDASQGMLVPKNPASKPWAESQRNHPMYKKFVISAEYSRNRVFGYRAREIFRYAEVLLIYAEAKTRASGVDETVLEALNQVKRRAAGLAYNVPNDSVDVTTTTAAEIVEEKGWELAGEFKRWWDLVRLEKVSEVAAKRDPTEEVELLKSPSEINWKQYIAPIPQSEIDKSGHLTQNPEGFRIQ